MSILVFLIALAAALRITRLAIQDTIAQPFRDSLERLESRGSRLGHYAKNLFDCPWCFGFWASTGITATVMQTTTAYGASWSWVTFAGVSLATSYLLGAIYSAVYTLEIFEPNA